VIILFEGALGSGKSLASTAFAIRDHIATKRRIISSTHIYNLGDYYEYLDYTRFLRWMNEDEELQNAIVVLDEAYLFVDSRLSQSALSRLLSYFFLQTRKRHVDLYVCSQQYELVDVRLRRNVDVRAICNFDKETGWCRVKLINLRNGKRKVIRIYGPEIFPYFDTDEIPKLRPGHIAKVVL